MNRIVRVSGAALLALGDAAQAERELPRELEVPVQAGVLAVGEATCRAMMLTPRHASVMLDCLQAGAPDGAGITDLSFYTRDGDGLPLFKLPVTGWMTLADEAPRVSPISEVRAVAEGMVFLSLDPYGWSLAEPDALGPVSETGGVRIVRALGAGETRQNDCDILRSLPTADIIDVAILCDMMPDTQNGLPAAQAAPARPALPKVNRGLGAPKPGPGALSFELEGLGGLSGASPGARFVRP